MDKSFTPSEPREVFISYASKDEKLLEEFEPYLDGLERREVIRSWHGRKIHAGEDWHKVISEHLNTAQIVLLLISKNFLASEYCYGVEFKLAMKRHKSGAARAIGIILHTCDWRSTPLFQLQVLPKGGKPVSKWDDIDEAFVNVANGISEVVNELKCDRGRQQILVPLESPVEARRPIPTIKYALGVTAVLIALTFVFIFRGYFPWARSLEANVQSAQLNHSSGAEDVRIQVNEVPPYDSVGGPTSGTHIAGNVSGASSPEFSVVIYSFTNAWYVQPTKDDAETRINPDGSWSAEIKRGTRYAVLVVHRNYQPPSPISTNPTRLDAVVTSVEFEGKR